MVKLWVLRGLSKGILTTKYPKASPTSEEIPSRSIPPTPGTTVNWADGERICLTGAIEANGGTMKSGRISLGKCVYCRMCSTAGFTFENRGTDSERPLNTSAALQASFPVKSTAAEEEFLKQLESKWKTFKKSFHILMLDVGSCNACNLEVLNLSNPYYDLQRLGIFFTNSPKHADALVVVGALNKAMVDVLKNTYELIPNPKLVISVGACPISGGIFQKTESFVSPVIDVIPVDVEIPGCPPSPIQILQGLLIAMGRLKPDNPTSNKNQPRQNEKVEN
ncbi:MAG: NADH-quinone oxidoreductase subunit B family protein [Nitrososphaerota archaeon]|nr:NADH-quinone oxidoreductase subunit B family protein [Nitrososphaerota archaeon]